MFAFLLVAFLVTLGVAIVGWFRPVPAKQPAPPTYSAQQVADAKTKVCAEYQRVHSAIKASTARDMGTDPTAQQVYGINGPTSTSSGKRISPDRAFWAARNSKRNRDDHPETHGPFSGTRYRLSKQLA